MPDLNKKIEIRSFGALAAPKLKRSADGKETRTIEGYAVVFNTRSQLLPDYSVYRMVQEVIDPEAIDENLLRSCDIKALLEHDPSRLLARSYMGQGTLTLTKDDKGFKYSFEAPDTTEGNYAFEMVKRGDLFGSSFAYITDEAIDGNVSYTKDGDTLIRTVHKIDKLFDVSIVSDPAYLDTSVTARSLDKALNIPEPKFENNDWKVDANKIDEALED
jgi:HK97 family phage prohead protease